MYIQSLQSPHLCSVNKNSSFSLNITFSDTNIAQRVGLGSEREVTGQV